MTAKLSLFNGIKILDLSRVFSGPFATRHFSDFGAEVIKIEPPSGDESRKFPPLLNNWSGYFEVLNRNKQAITLDLKNESDLSKLYQLSREADVFVENFSPSIKKKLKVDYEHIKKYNDKIIYASISGISAEVNRKYYDIIAQAESGFVSLNGETEDMKVATSVVDAFSGMKLAFAISSALYFREKNNLGTQITVSMKGSAFDLLEQNLIASSISKQNPPKVGNMDTAIAPFGIFKTKDGSIALAIGNESLWQRFLSFVLQENAQFPTEQFTSNDARLQNLPLLKAELEKVFSKFGSKKLVEVLQSLEIPCGEIKTMTEVIRDKENFEQQLLTTYAVAGVEVVVPTGGIFYSNIEQEKCKPAPHMASSDD